MTDVDGHRKEALNKIDELQRERARLRTALSKLVGEAGVIYREAARAGVAVHIAAYEEAVGLLDATPYAQITPDAATDSSPEVPSRISGAEGPSRANPEPPEPHG